MNKLPDYIPSFFLLSCIVGLLAASCHAPSPADARKDIRIGWKTYFNAYLDFKGKESKMGTDSTKIIFENNSDYIVDSATVIFENQGLLVHSFDTVNINFIASKSQKAVLAPSHKLGWKHKVEIFAIYSKALEFRYKGDFPEAKRQGDCFYCK
ncbi:hypothetical protein BH11BAC7_BH11BAC7_27440 [soil metagenome]